MDVLTIRHILDNILMHLRNDDYCCYEDNCVNLITALNLSKEYGLRELKLNSEDCCSKTIINHSFKYFSPEIIRSHFSKIWDKADLSKLSERFFVDNCDLIDHAKLRHLKKQCVGGDLNSNLVIQRIFSKRFHETFPEYETIHCCREYHCYNETGAELELCSTCKTNQCPRCQYVVSPQIVLDQFGCCEGCAGCSQYDEYYD